MSQEIPTNGLRWWPSDYIDEGMLPGMATPDAWLRRMPNGDGWTIASPYYDDAKEEIEREWKFEPLANGQRVEFVFCQQLGTVDVTVNPDGTFEAHGPVNPDATWFWDDDQRGDDCPAGDNIEEFAKFYVEGMRPTEPTRVTVGCSHWSEGKTYSVKIEVDVATLEEAGMA